MVFIMFLYQNFLTLTLQPQIQVFADFNINYIEIIDFLQILWRLQMMEHERKFSSSSPNASTSVIYCNANHAFQFRIFTISILM